MKLFGRDVTDVNTTLDTFTHVSQKSGAPVGALISQVRTFGPVFKNANISLDETVGFMGAMETAGVDITRVMPAINASLRKAATEGVTDLRGHLGDLIESIRDTESGTDALSIATEAFGAEGAQRMTAAIRSGALPALDELSTMFGDTTGAVERTYEEGKTWRDTLREMKDGALAYLGPGGDMVGAIGSAASGLALAGPGMLGWIKGLKLATLAQKGFNLAMKLNPIGLVVTALVIVGAAIYTWRDQIWDFLNGAWGGFISGLVTGYNKIADIIPGMERIAVVAKDEIAPDVAAATLSIADLSREAKAAADVAKDDLAPDVAAATLSIADLSREAKAAADVAKDDLAPDVAAATLNIADLSREAKAASGKLATDDTSLVAGLEAADKVADDFITTVKDLPEYVGTAVNSIGKSGALGGDFLRSGADLGTQYSKAFAAGFVTSGPGGVVTVLPMAIVGGLGSPSLGKSFADSGLQSAGKWSTNFFSTMSSAFEGGGGLMGGFKSLVSQGFGSMFLAEGEASAGGFIGKMQEKFTQLGGIPLVGPLLAQFGPALLGGIAKLAGKVWMV